MPPPPPTGRKIPSILDNDCERPACADIQQMFRQHQQQATTTTVTGTTTAPQNSNTTKTAITLTKLSSTPDIVTLDDIETSRVASLDHVSQCPVDSSTLGRASWALLHSMVAWYPDQPSKEDQSHMRNFFHSFARFYPCTYCATDFQQNIQEQPATVQTRQELCIWLCEQHNKVNEKLGKGTFPCTIDKLDQRWRKSNDPKCQR